MYNKGFIAIAKVEQENVDIDDPELAKTLLQVQDIALPVIKQAEVSCTICLDEAQQPVSLECGHVFCRSCVNAIKTADSGRVRCPLCRRENAKQPPIPLMGGTFTEYISELRKRLSVLVEAEQEARSMVESFPRLQEQYKQAHLVLDKAVLEEQIRSDSLRLRIEERQYQAEMLEEKCSVLEEAISGLKTEVCD